MTPPCSAATTAPASSAPRVIGTSPAWRAAQARVELLAAEGYWCPLEGPSGTGKEVLARIYHAATTKAGRKGAFVKVHCGAIPDGIFEALFFGQVRGAFTGADRDRPGYFEQADGGTLLLDEVHAFPPEQQVKLLRVLQEGEVPRVGGLAPIPVDVRIVVATNRDLWAEVVAGRFLPDLYYRLYQADPIRVPSLSERREDLPALVQLVLDQDGKALRVSAAALAALCAGDYSEGEVRALQRTVRRAYLAAKESKAEVIEERHVRAPASGQSCKPAGGERPWKTRAEKAAELDCSEKEVQRRAKRGEIEHNGRSRAASRYR